MIKKQVWSYQIAPASLSTRMTKTGFILNLPCTVDFTLFQNQAALHQHMSLLILLLINSYGLSGLKNFINDVLFRLLLSKKSFLQNCFMKYLFIVPVLFFSFCTFAQQGVAVNTDGSAPHPSAMLDVKSTIKEFLLPRISAHPGLNYCKISTFTIGGTPIDCSFSFIIDKLFFI